MMSLWAGQSRRRLSSELPELIDPTLSKLSVPRGFQKDLVLECPELSFGNSLRSLRGCLPTAARDSHDAKDLCTGFARCKVDSGGVFLVGGEAFPLNEPPHRSLR